MNKPSCLKKLAVDELIQQDTAQNYSETLDDFFECWLTSDLTDNADANLRAIRYFHLTKFKEFLKSIDKS